MRERVKKERQPEIDRFDLENRQREFSERKGHSEVLASAEQSLKAKYHPTFVELYNRMCEYSQDAKAFFSIEKNKECPPELLFPLEDDAINWYEVYDSQFKWDRFFYIFDVSPFISRPKAIGWDMSPSEEDIIMGALRNRDGDRYGY